mmetsp:Transcript_65484/g.161256  ORF Transcript_65484/g.161256 Transcript_65484/m.161256 type:complete len:236 (-) Transcript_65484:55-762(-)
MPLRRFLAGFFVCTMPRSTCPYLTPMIELHSSELIGMSSARTSRLTVTTFMYWGGNISQMHTDEPSRKTPTATSVVGLRSASSEGTEPSSRSVAVSAGSAEVAAERSGVDDWLSGSGDDVVDEVVAAEGDDESSLSPIVPRSLPGLLTEVPKGWGEVAGCWLVVEGPVPGLAFVGSARSVCGSVLLFSQPDGNDAVACGRWGYGRPWAARVHAGDRWGAPCGAWCCGPPGWRLVR